MTLLSILSSSSARYIGRATVAVSRFRLGTFAGIIGNGGVLGASVFALVIFTGDLGLSTFTFNSLFILEFDDIFFIDQDEVSIDNFSCALSDKILVQGKLVLIVNNRSFIVFYTNDHVLHIKTLSGRSFESPFKIDHLIHLYLNDNHNLMILDK
jgi:hypothetical protein